MKGVEEEQVGHRRYNLECCFVILGKVKWGDCFNFLVWGGCQPSKVWEKLLYSIIMFV